MKKQTMSGLDPEVVAINDVYSALRNLDTEAQVRVMRYVAAKLGLSELGIAGPRAGEDAGQYTDRFSSESVQDSMPETDDQLQGISSTGKKWIARNGLQLSNISSLFSLGVDDIDLVAKKVPGKSKKDRLRSVFLLKGVAAYLGSGSARLADDDIREACMHYDAYDRPNFAKYVKELASEISGNKSSGYSLTSRGLNNAAEVVKEMLKE